MKGARGVALAALLVLAGCSGNDPADHDPVRAAPGIRWHDCAQDVEIALTTEHRCGTLTVPIDHGDPDGTTLGLELVEVWPSQTADDGAVALSVGFNFGEPRQPPGDMHALAERIGVRVVSLTPRGVGQDGGLALDCPELDNMGAGAPNLPDAESGEAFVDAVADCRTRLTRDGVDLDLFGIDDIADDVEHLRTALGVDLWYALISYGELSRVTDAYTSSHGDHVRAVVKDSPAPSGRDSFAAAAAGLRSALAALFTECADDPACAQRYPDVEDRWQRALERVIAQPLSGSSTNGPVLVDAPGFMRAVRSMLGGAAGSVTDLPRIITLAADGQLHPALASIVATDPDHCLGYRPICTAPGFSLGAYLSQACPELNTSDTAEADPLYRRVFLDSPYADACDMWDVESAAPPEDPDVPTLVLTGDLDSWSRPEWFRDPVIVRGAGHDVAGSAQCVFAVRNPWIANPAEAADPQPCESEPFPAWD